MAPDESEDRISRLGAAWSERRTEMNQAFERMERIRARLHELDDQMGAGRTDDAETLADPVAAESLTLELSAPSAFQLGKSSAEIERLGEQLDKARREEARLDAQLAEERDRVRQAVDYAARERGRLERLLVTRGEEVEAARRRLRAARATEAAVAAEAARLDTANVALERRAVELQEHRRELERRVERAEGQAAEAAQELATARLRSTQLQEELAAAGDERAALEAKAADAEDETERVRSQLQSELARALEHAEGLRTQTEAVQADLDRAVTAERGAREETAALQERLDSTRDTHLARVRELEQALSVLTAGLNEVHKDLERVAGSTAWRYGHRMSRTATRMTGGSIRTEGAVAAAIARVENLLDIPQRVVTPASSSVPVKA